MFIGRENEIKALEGAFENPRSTISVVYGRRRIGKTFLIKQAARGLRFFSFEGAEGLPSDKQKRVFLDQLTQLGINTSQYDPSASWFQILSLLGQLASADEPVVILLDELQWLANYRAELVSSLKIVWDQLLAVTPRVHLVLCGSVASFMVNKVIRSQALYGRCDLTINLQPFCLRETGLLLAASTESQKAGSKSSEEIVLAQLLVGGIPKYLELLTDRDSILSSLAFHCSKRTGYFVNEYEKIFVSHFGQNPQYQAIVKLLSNRHYGLSRQEIAASLGLANSGQLTEVLENLATAGFIRDFVPFDLKSSTRTKRYLLVDHYVSFYLNFLEPLIASGEIDRIDLVNQLFSTPKMAAWLGHSFELLCLNHADQIAKILGFSAVRYQCGPFFRHNKKGEIVGVQFDLVFKRADKVFVVCEAKYQSSSVGEEVGQKLRAAIAEAPELAGKTVQRVLITNAEVTRAVNSGLYFNAVVKIEDLLN